MGFLSELFRKKKEGPFESYYESGQLRTKLNSLKGLAGKNL